ncbi:MAG: hypothetical protein Faunusvirus8_31 [Faunusvirus sp.]|uniref:Uncharacterized protein n=1 Tax=Faunusvirus sp. TaxID=2487766 RepID=A0A3G4ZYB9_9VIRU|nr:MAG: hypothetical protein Faunusvirus8_31 [Faunusvirus sp.]
MNYIVTDIPLEKSNIVHRSKQKCELHKFADGTELLMYTIIGGKHTIQFVFDQEDFDIINGKPWKRHRNTAAYDGIPHSPGPGLYVVAHYIRDKYLFSNRQFEFKNIKNNDYRKI